MSHRRHVPSGPVSPSAHSSTHASALHAPAKQPPGQVVDTPHAVTTFHAVQIGASAQTIPLSDPLPPPEDASSGCIAAPPWLHATNAIAHTSALIAHDVTR